MWAHHTTHFCCLQGENDTPAERGGDVLLHPVVLQAKSGGADGGRNVLAVLA